MAKQPRYKHVKIVRVKRTGLRYAYFNTGIKVDGKPVYRRLPDPADVGFWDSYAAFMAGRTKRAATQYTVANLVNDYLTSAEFKKKARASQEAYGYSAAKVERTLGEFPVNELEHSDIQLVIDGEGWGWATRNAFVGFIGTIYKWGRLNGKARIKPAEDFEREKGGEHAPWPENVLEAALRADDALVRLSTHLLYFTGQRIGDVLRMTWNDIRAGSVSVRQQKTGKTVDVPLMPELAAELDRTPRTGVTIMGLPATKAGSDRVRLALQAFAAGQGETGKIVTHGLRKNAVNALLEAGCTIAETAAITGQSFAMVEKYARKVDQRKLGQAAILKFGEARRERGA